KRSGEYREVASDRLSSGDRSQDTGNPGCGRREDHLYYRGTGTSGRMGGSQQRRSVMKRLFIDGLGGMAQGLFATLIIGTIIQQIGTFIGGGTGDVIFLI